MNAKMHIFKTWGIFVVLLGGMALPALGGTYSGGIGTAEDPYLISTAEDMQSIGANVTDWGKHFLLTADIDLSAYTGTEFNIIGNYSDPFSGVFDANGHTISNFSFNTGSGVNIGLFGYVYGADAVIKDLTSITPDVNAAGYSRNVGCLVGRLEYGTVTGCGVQGGSITGGIRVGGLVGENWYGTISTCYSLASVSEGFSVGGLVGFNYGGLITSNCYSAGSVSGMYGVGGLVGNNMYGTIKNCYSTSSTSGTNCGVGGLVGSNRGYWNDVIENCYSTGSVDGNDSVGGLVGDNAGIIKKCYSIGSVIGDANVGGLLGYAEGGIVSACFWDVDTSGQNGSAGGEGKTTQQMQTQSTFTDAGWDFVGETTNGERDIWDICEGNYPKLTPQAAFYGGGDGSANNPYQIWKRHDMNEIWTNPEDWNKYFILMADVNLASYTGTQFNVIGSYSDPFTGVFDGNGRTISNFTYNSTYSDCIGFFGYIRGASAVIKDLTLMDPNVTAAYSYMVGCLVGRLESGTITGCGVDGGRVTGQTAEAAGLAGINFGKISNCYATASVSGGRWTGGLVGDNDGTISNCYAGGSVSGTESTGGLVGRNFSTISNCYAVGSVTGDAYTGGLVGGLSGIVSNSFWDVNTTGQSSSAGGKGKTTQQMQTQSTFTDGGWDFIDEAVNGPNDIWDICEGTNYPKLTWQIPLPGDFVCPDGVEISDLDVFTQQWLMEKLSADVAAGGGDGIVDFLDWAVFANTWQNTSDIVQVLDFAQQWLNLGAYCADIAPPGGDGAVDMLDFAVLAENWLKGIGQ